jgi:hypothetical protein
MVPYSSLFMIVDSVGRTCTWIHYVSIAFKTQTAAGMPLQSNDSDFKRELSRGSLQ